MERDSFIAAQDPDGFMARQVAVVRQAFAAISSGEPELLQALFADGIAMDFPFAPPEAPRRLEGKADVMAVISKLAGIFSEFHLEAARFFSAPQRNTVIAEATSHGVLVDGGAYANRYAMLIGFAGLQIVTWREFYDPMRLPRALSRDVRISQ